MYEKVLIPTDFSKHTNPILECVGEIPGVIEVVLLHIVAGDPLARVWSPGDKIKEANSKLEELKKLLEDRGLKVKVMAVSAGENEEYKVIQNVADEENVSLIVMGARGRSILRGLLLGSVSTGVLRYGKQDLLIMRYKSLEDENLGMFCSHLFSNLLLPTDFSEAGMAAINRVKGHALANNVQLINVVAKGESAQEVEARVKDAQMKLDAIRDDLTKAGIKATAKVIVADAGEPRTYGTGGMAAVHNAAPFVNVGGEADNIISTSEKEDSSMIAMSSHGKGWMNDLLIGSVVFDVARRGTRPVLVVRYKKNA
jgi:nucleotide-binding universal stress UspA family protein